MHFRWDEVLCEPNTKQLQISMNIKKTRLPRHGA